jgi:hypothetical protein
MRSSDRPLRSHSVRRGLRLKPATAAAGWAIVFEFADIPRHGEYGIVIEYDD